MHEWQLVYAITACSKWIVPWRLWNRRFGHFALRCLTYSWFDLINCLAFSSVFNYLNFGTLRSQHNDMSEPMCRPMCRHSTRAFRALSFFAGMSLTFIELSWASFHYFVFAHSILWVPYFEFHTLSTAKLPFASSNLQLVNLYLLASYRSATSKHWLVQIYWRVESQLLISVPLIS